mmetsp:Transcript_32637/g.87622  ORF Transcript_32637/g.87622 Transcript_32637/m.87622 type:complete len:91 (+) Transcript_32637:1550-1822(+)
MREQVSLVLPKVLSGSSEGSMRQESFWECLPQHRRRWNARAIVAVCERELRRPQHKREVAQGQPLMGRLLLALHSCYQQMPLPPAPSKNL